MSFLLLTLSSPSKERSISTTAPAEKPKKERSLKDHTFLPKSTDEGRMAPGCSVPLTSWKKRAEPGNDQWSLPSEPADSCSPEFPGHQ